MSIISVEGNIGAGKTTLLGVLCVETIKEPVEEWENTAGSNILQRYYEDPKRWAFTFQLNALHSRCKLWEDNLRNNEKKLFFSERSPHADRNIFGEIMNREGNF
jgi:deoxyadenosine/deoxycytidine kinase